MHEILSVHIIIAPMTESIIFNIFKYFYLRLQTIFWNFL